MPIQFPTNPEVNQEYTYEGKVWQWDGSAWVGVRQETGIQRSNIWSKQNLLIPKRGFGLNSGYNGATDQRRTQAGTINSAKHYMERNLGVFSYSDEWTPAQITTELWLDASDASTITLNGSNVSQWDDKSGNGRHATQGVAAQQPVYTENAINGNPSLTFANTAKSLLMASSVFTTNPKVFIVLKSTTGSQAQVPLRLQGSINEFLFVLNATSSNQVYFTRRGLEQRPVTHTVTNTTIYFADLFPTSIGDYYINGTLATKQNNIGNAGGNTNTNVIGADAGNANRFQGDLAECIVLSSIDTDTRQLIEGYLAHKWGLTANLPADHPYKNSAPTV